MRTFGTHHIGGFVPGDALVPRALRGYLQTRAFWHGEYLCKPSTYTIPTKILL